MVGSWDEVMVLLRRVSVITDMSHAGPGDRSEAQVTEWIFVTVAAKRSSIVLVGNLDNRENAIMAANL